MTPRLVVDAPCTLGEGLVWDARRQGMLWTDIERAAIWIHYLDDESTQQWQVPDRLGSFALCASGRLLLGLAKGLYFATLPARADEPVQATLASPVETDVAGTRVNDGRTDRDGAFVFGTYSERDESPIAALYQYSTRHGLRRLDLGSIACANSICFSRDGATMFYCDSPTRRIMQCRYDSADARVEDARTFVAFGPDQGLPDGSVVDAEGCLWNAEWGGGCVRRYDPAGALMQTIAVPATRTTCVGFGGRDLDRLFVTSARTGLDAAALAAQPESGGLHVVTPGVRGIADAHFAD